MAKKAEALVLPVAETETPPEPVCSAGVAAVHDVLTWLLWDMANKLSLPMGMEGKTFTPPLGTHLRGKVVVDKIAAASLGESPLTRVDGALEITVTTRAGLGQSTAMAVAQSVCTALPRGTRIPFGNYDKLDKGEITLCSHAFETPSAQSDRYRVIVRIPFYAFTKE